VLRYEVKASRGGANRRGAAARSRIKAFVVEFFTAENNIGLGSSLLKKLMEPNVAGKCERVDLHVLRSNTRAMDYYTKRGFCEVTDRRLHMHQLRNHLWQYMSARMENLSISPELDVYKGNVTLLTFPDLRALRSWSRFHELEKLGKEVHSEQNGGDGVPLEQNLLEPDNPNQQAPYLVALLPVKAGDVSDRWDSNSGATPLHTPVQATQKRKADLSRDNGKRIKKARSDRNSGDPAEDDGSNSAVKRKRSKPSNEIDLTASGPVAEGDGVPAAQNVVVLNVTLPVHMCMSVASLQMLREEAADKHQLSIDAVEAVVQPDGSVELTLSGAKQ
jgi:hypothetical protein